MKKDYVLRMLAISAFFIAFFFSWIDQSIDKGMLAWIWGIASLLYWVIVWHFEERDHKAAKENGA